MGRSKPRTNKRPPPKLNRKAGSPGAPPTVPPPALPPSAPLPPPVPFEQGVPSFLSPAAALDPTDPSFPSAFQHWSSSALSQLGQLPRLTPSQLSAIAGAAAGIGDVSLFSAAAAASGVGVGTGPIDLPASLAALFEAKLTLDREKAKLLRMQKELKGYRDGVAAAVESVGGLLMASKGKEVAVGEELGECTCGRGGHTHEYAASAHSGSDEYYYYDTEDEGCDCCSHTHSYVECDHAPGECDCEEESEEQSHHHHHHHHHGEIDSDADEYQYEDRHTCTHDHQARLPPDEEAAFASAQPGDEIPNDSHVEANGASGATNGMDQPHSNGDGRKRLAEDPEKMDEAVRELFNWIKAVVWTIEQAAIVAGRRGWGISETRYPDP